MILQRLHVDYILLAGGQLLSGTSSASDFESSDAERPRGVHESAGGTLFSCLLLCTTATHCLGNLGAPWLHYGNLRKAPDGLRHWAGPQLCFHTAILLGSIVNRLKWSMLEAHLHKVPDPSCDADVVHEAPCSKAARATEVPPRSHPRQDHAKTDE